MTFRGLNLQAPAGVAPSNAIREYLFMGITRQFGARCAPYPYAKEQRHNKHLTTKLSLFIII
jgi:hypothetical protein